MLDSLGVSPRQVVLDPGDTVQLSAEAFGPEGQPLNDVQFIWTVSDQRTGSLSETGSFQAGNTPGVFESSVSVTAIQNTPDGMKYLSEFVSITVVGEARVPRLSSVAIFPSDPTVLKQQIYRLRAVGFDQDGMVIRQLRMEAEASVVGAAQRAGLPDRQG